MDHLMGVTVTFCACVGPVLDNRGGWVGGGIKGQEESLGLPQGTDLFFFCFWLRHLNARSTN